MATETRLLTTRRGFSVGRGGYGPWESTYGCLGRQFSWAAHSGCIEWSVRSSCRRAT